MRFVVAILACMGCKQLVGIEDGVVVDAGAAEDIAGDTVTIDAPEVGECYGMAPYRICLPQDQEVDDEPDSIINTSLPCRFTYTSDGRSWCVFVQDDLVIETIIAGGS